MAYDLTFDGVKMPVPAREGIKPGDQIIWASNSGRVANAEFVGDVIAVKKTLEITWNRLTYAQFDTIRSHLTRLGHPFITVNYTDSDGIRKSFTGYTEGASSTIVTYTADGQIEGVVVNIVEK